MSLICRMRVNKGRYPVGINGIPTLNGIMLVKSLAFRKVWKQVKDMAPLTRDMASL